jgi:glutathione S-transferase
MKLYYSPASPYVRKVMVTLHLTGQARRWRRTKAPSR